MDIQVTEFQAPIITINYETLSAELDNFLANYTGLVVTEETLAGCKAAQKELASLRVKIDTYRKDKKKELEEPIKTFEAQCKTLIAKVEQAEQPIKDGIKVYDDQKREEKRQTALQLAADVAAETGLNEKYAAKLDVLDKYTNLTATAKAVREDLETRAFALKVEQDREAERLEIITSVLNSENARLQTKLSIEFVRYEIERDVPTSIIIEKIKAQAALVYEAENKPVEPPKEAEPTPEPPKEEKQPETPQAQPEKQYTATLKLVGKLEELRSVSAFLKANGISYEVLDQREV
jgi:vacuolar-type H+-ATPase subunit I/STV1